jgi:hypothetical protein
MAVTRYIFAAVLALLFTTALQNYSVQAQEDKSKESDMASETSIDADALQILKDMSDALSSLKEFSFDAQISNDETLDNGQTVQLNGLLKVSVKRPGQVYGEFTGEGKTRKVWYNGKELTIFNPEKGFYGVIDTPGTIDETMDFLMENYRFSLPIADIIYSDPYSSFIGTTREGFVVGDDTVNGKSCVHLAMRGEFADWQVWVSEDDPALPCKLVINYTQIEGVPQYQAVFSNWNTDPKLSASVFKPELPEEAVKIDFINFKQEGDKNDAK